MTNYDNKSGKKKKKMDILNKAKEIYDLDINLYKNIKQSLDFEENNDY